MASDRKYVVMGFGLGGNHGDGIENGNVFSSTWYIKDAENFQEYIDNGHYPSGQMEGCLLVDKVPALEENPMLAYEAPMVGVKMADDDVDRMQDYLQSDAARMVTAAIAEHNSTVAVLTAKALTDDSFIGLDKVSPKAYVAWWKAKGARVGVVCNGKCVWEDR